MDKSLYQGVLSLARNMGFEVKETYIRSVSHVSDRRPMVLIRYRSDLHDDTKRIDRCKQEVRQKLTGLPKSEEPPSNPASSIED